MKLTLPKSLLSLVLMMLVSIAYGQVSIKGQVTDKNTGEALIGVSILVKGTVLGTITDVEGFFTLDVKSPPPVSLIVSSVGYERLELEVNQASVSSLKIEMVESFMLGQEVVVSASRVEENILQSPVSIEKMDILAVQQTPADNYYKGIQYLKGVDVTQSSINFQIVNARGFNSTGNTRFVQLTDGMDTQAPALNFPIGNLNGPSELDVESVEFISGAQSALYGPNAFNGLLRVTSKSPFDYQGFSAFAKAGVNHIGADESAGAPATPQPMFDVSLRYAKAFNDKFAFKVNWSYMKAEDWYATDYQTDREAQRQGDLPYNPGKDAPNYMGDEAGVNLAILSFSSAWRSLGNPLNNYYALNGGSTPVDVQSFANNGFLPNQVVTVTPFEEHELIDYGAENMKANVGLYFRPTDRLELSYLYNAGFGTSIYTGAQRYSLKNFGIQQHRIQAKGDNWFLRGYATLENSGDSYITEFYAKRVTDLSISQAPLAIPQDVSVWLGTYGYNYLRYLQNNLGYNPNSNSPTEVTQAQQIEAYQFAREQTEALYDIDFSSDAGKRILDNALNGVVPTGPKFNDQSKLYHGEFQYDFKNEIEFMELLAGASFRMYDLQSNGTIFPDSESNPITISEYGAYMQGTKRVLDDKVKLIGSIRVDKNQNFNAVWSPRISTVVSPVKNHNFRFSYQTGFRNPTTQGQHINLNIISSRLLGGLPQNLERYEIGTNPYLYTLESVDQFAGQIFAATPAQQQDPAYIGTALALLDPIDNFTPVKPEQVKGFELGYKSLINNKLMIDLVGYVNNYNNFIVQQRMRRAALYTTNQAAADADPLLSYNADASLEGQPNPFTLLNGTADNTYQVYTNATESINAMGFAGEVTYLMPGHYTFGVNYSWNKLDANDSEDFVFGFNTPEHKFNLKFGNRKLTDEIGFNIVYRWQTDFYWESSFGDGDIPAYGTLDAQVTYKTPVKALVKVGGSNILNNYYIQSIGAPNIGAIYYVSVTFDSMMK